MKTSVFTVYLHLWEKAETESSLHKILTDINTMKTQKCVCWRCEDVTNPLGSTDLLRLQE